MAALRVGVFLQAIELVVAIQGILSVAFSILFYLHVVVSQNTGAPIQTPKYCNPSCGTPKT